MYICEYHSSEPPEVAQALLRGDVPANLHEARLGVLRLLNLFSCCYCLVVVDMSIGLFKLYVC